MSLLVKLKFLYPNFLAIILVFLSIIPIKIPGMSSFYPLIVLMFIYYWCIYKPRSMPYWFLFAIGILQSSLTGSPYGINELCNILMRFLTIYKKNDFNENAFVNIWKGFAILASIITIIQWILFSFVFDSFLNIDAAVMQLLLSIAIYPVFHCLFNQISSLLPGRSSYAK